MSTVKKRKISVLHLTPHLGGGVGRALSGLIRNTPPESNIIHTVVCLERPKNTQFIEQLKLFGCSIFITPDSKTLRELIEQSTIIQVEWWNHPALLYTLCAIDLPAMRTITWCHGSNLYSSCIPEMFLYAIHRCIFTSSCSYRAPEVLQLLSSDKYTVINSTGGFDGLEYSTRENQPVSAGYIGSFNFAKLHPYYVDFLDTVKIPNFTVKMIGDTVNKDELLKHCEQIKKPNLLDFVGYTNNVADELSKITIMPYLLNPLHYGTTENALLEAMVTGVVPIVLRNPAEVAIVQHNKTGLIVDNKKGFSDAVSFLYNNKKKREELSRNASINIKERFSINKTVQEFISQYKKVALYPKVKVQFYTIFGRSPFDWFLSCQRRKDIFLSNASIDEFTLPGLLEESKGSVFQYQQYFPKDPTLDMWCKKLNAKNTTGYSS